MPTSVTPFNEGAHLGLAANSVHKGSPVGRYQKAREPFAAELMLHVARRDEAAIR